MKRFVIAFLISISAFSPAQANSGADNLVSQILASSKSGVFTYHIPDDDSKIQTENTDDEDEITLPSDDTPQAAPSQKTNKKKAVISDDITADTTEKQNDKETKAVDKSNAAEESSSEDDEEYGLDDMYSYILKGSVSYDEDEENAVPLNLKDNQYITLNITKPVTVKESYFGNLKSSDSLFDNSNYSMYNGSEYSIKPISSEASKSQGGWSAGTTYNQGIDYGELEQSSGVYSKYQYKNFAISTSFAKTINSTNNDYNNNFYLSPEFAINQYFKVKSYVSVDTAKKRKKAEVTLSINPFGNKDNDRFLFELGANETYDEVNGTFKNQFKFSTNFKF